VSLFRIFGQEPTVIEIVIEVSFTPKTAKLRWLITGSSMLVCVMGIHKDLEVLLHFLIILFERVRNMEEFRKDFWICSIFFQ
jgi:hypothetical protein